MRVLPYVEDDPTGPKRTHKETIEWAKEAASTGEVVSSYRLT